MVLDPCGTYDQMCSNSTNQVGSAGPVAGVAAAIFLGGRRFFGGAGAVAAAAAVMAVPFITLGRVTHADGKVICVISVFDGVVVVAVVLVCFSARLFHDTLLSLISAEQ